MNFQKQLKIFKYCHDEKMEMMGDTLKVSMWKSAEGFSDELYLFGGICCWAAKELIKSVPKLDVIE